MTSDKPALRSRLRALRDHLAAANPIAAHALAALCPVELLRPTIVSAYQPFRNEIDPAPLLARLVASGARIALPVTPPKDAPGPLTFRLWTTGAALAPGHFAVHEPGADAPEVDPDIILAPLLAFDAEGNRLGYGAGHYDRTIQALRLRKSIRYIGLAYAGQEVASLPAGPHDERLDAILTETGYRVIRED
jgi:5-formyltetrahydrofolate cyclo-ligase